MSKAESGARRLRLTRVRAIVALAVAMPTLALPSAAGAITLIGSGSSAAYPYMQELFRGYSQLHHNIQFKYNPDGGNAGVQDVQDGRSESSINTRPPLPSDGHTTQVKLFLDALCIAVNKDNKPPPRTPSHKMGAFYSPEPAPLAFSPGSRQMHHAP